MKNIFKSYENILLLLSLLVLSSVLLANNAKNKEKPNAIEKLTLTIASPLQGIAASGIGKVDNIWKHYINLSGVSKENEELKKTLAEERLKTNLLMEELKRYRRVDTLLSFHPIAKTKFQIADVIAWDSTNTAQTFVINKGTAGNIGEGMIVLTHEGLVGRIVASTRNSSRVLMITDSRSAVDAYVQGNRVRGIVVGQNKKDCFVQYLPIDSEINVGDKLISSGLGGNFPKGLELGVISSLKPDIGKLFYKVEMTPAANLKGIEEVLIMTSLPKNPKKSLLGD